MTQSGISVTPRLGLSVFGTLLCQILYPRLRVRHLYSILYIFHYTVNSCVPCLLQLTVRSS